jgi:hypothetical protein
MTIYDNATETVEFVRTVILDADGLDREKLIMIARAVWFDGLPANVSDALDLPREDEA